MSDTTGSGGALDRRDFFKTAGAGLTAAGLMLAPGQGAAAQASAEKDRLARIASNSYPIRWIFKTRSKAAAAVRQRRRTRRALR